MLILLKKQNGVIRQYQSYCCLKLILETAWLVNHRVSTPPDVWENGIPLPRTSGVRRDRRDLGLRLSNPGPIFSPLRAGIHEGCQL